MEHTIDTQEAIQTNADVKDFLNSLTATYGLFYVKLHEAHWYVKGSAFFELHKTFEELYDNTTEQMDEVAERLLTIGGEPFSSLSEYLENSIIEEKPSYKGLAQAKMVETVINDFQSLQVMLGKGIETADHSGDDVTTDLLISQKAKIDKTVWILQAFLGRGALENG